MVLALVALITAFFASRLPLLNFDYDFEAFFPNENQELKQYNDFRKTFEYDNEFVLLGIESEKGLFNRTFLLKTDSLSQELGRIEGVQRVTSPTRLTRLRFDGLLPYSEPVLHINEEDRYAGDSAAIYQDPGLVNSYFPLDAGSLCFYIKTAEGLSKAKSDRLAEAIQKCVAGFGFSEVHYAGRIFAQKIYLDQLRKEFLQFILISFLLVLLFLWFSFRTLYGTLVPVTVVIVSVLWTLGIMQLMDKPIDLMCTILPTMIFVAGMSDVVHYFSKYFEERNSGTDPKLIFIRIRREVAYPTFLTLLTTIIGFLSLLFSSMQPVRDFGIYTSIGISIAFVLTYTLLPSLIRLFPPSQTRLHSHLPQSEFIPMRKGMHLALRYQKPLLAAFIVLITLSSIGMSRMRVDNILLEDLSSKIQVKQDFDFFDQHYSGARPFELKVMLKDTTHSVWDYAILNQVQQMDSFIRAEYQAGFILSAAGVVKQINLQVYNSARFPGPQDYPAIQKLINQHKNNKDLLRLADKQGRTTRISAKIKDMGSAKVNHKNEALLHFIHESGIDKTLQVEFTGAAHLMDRNNAYMVENMLQGFAFSIFLIALLTYLVHRSWRIVLVFLLPNLVPLLVVSGIMGFTGIELKSSTSLVFSIAFGIATDDTIHFISRFRIELQSGKNYLYAFKRSYLETGKPIVLTTLILLGGFLTLMLSDFKSIFYFGFLICITMLIALLADLFLLPVLLFLIYPKSKKTLDSGAS